MLPTFLIIGAMRSGTTSLYRYLSEHPEIRFSATKETHFFDLHFDRGVDWYKSQFAADGEVLQGEATATYLYEPGAIDRLADTVPGAKLVVTLRNPIDRAYSHYWLQRSRRRESLSFEEALAAEPERVAAASPPRAQFAYLGCSRYVEQLRHVRERYPAEQLHVLLFEELRDDPPRVFGELCGYLGIDRGVRPPSLGAQANRHVEFRSRTLQRLAVRLPGPARRALNRVIRRDDEYPAMDPATRSRLASEFAPLNTALAEWLGRDLAVWER